MPNHAQYFSGADFGPHSRKDWPTLSQNDTDVAYYNTGVAHYNVNTHQPILVIFGRDVAERVCYQKVICYPTSPN